MSPLAVKKLSPEKDIHWEWPLNIGYLPSTFAEKTIEEAKKTHWGGRLSYNYVLGKGRLRANLIILHGTLDNVLKEITGFEYDINVDMVIVFLKDAVPSDSQLKKVNELIVYHTNSSGILYTTQSGNFAYFVEDLIFNLSHNTDIQEILERIINDGKLFISNKLVKASKLAATTDLFWRKIKSLPQKAMGDVLDAVLVGDMFGKILSRSPSYSRGPTDNAKEKVVELIKANKHARFEHESDEASDNAEVRKKAKQKSGKIVNSSVTKSKIQRAIKKTQSRILQCAIKDKQDENINTYLEIHKLYKLKVNIGPPQKEYLSAGLIAADAIAFTGKNPEEIRIAVRINDTVSVDNIYLTAEGMSTEASFDFSPKTKDQQIIEIYAYHKSRLIQFCALSIFVVDDPTAFNAFPFSSIEQMVSPKMVLDNLSERMTFGASFISLLDGKNESLLSSSEISNVKTLPLETGLQDMNRKIKGTIETAVINIDEHPSDIFHENNVDLLRYLAIEGSGLYTNYLEGIADFDDPIQIISRKSDYLPIEFVYTDPCPSLDSELCPNAKIALKAGKCEECEKRKENQTEYFCPLGFVSMRTVIERHDYGAKKELLNGDDIGIYSEPTSSRNTISITENMIFGSADRVENKSPGLIQQVADSVKDTALNFSQAKSWSEWKKNIKSSTPKTLVLISHTEKTRDERYEQLEIGNKDLVLKQKINETYVTKNKAENAPALFLIGCGTQDNEKRFVDFSSQFKSNGASIILSTFTKIRGRHAGPIVIQLMKFMKEHKGKEMLFGELVLKLRQHMLSEGLIVSLSLIAHGDADWKIKL